MHVLLKEPTHPDSQRRSASGFAAAQTIVASEHNLFVPCMISAPDPRYPFEGYRPPIMPTPPAPWAVALAGPAGIHFLKGAKHLNRLKLKKAMSYLSEDLEEAILRDLAAGEAALSEVKRILLANERLFDEIQDETYRFGSYLPKPEENIEKEVASQA